MSINAPIITTATGVFGATWADRWDINGAFTWDATGQTLGDTEIWIRRVFVDADFSKWGTVGFAARAFTIGHLCAASPDPIHYQIKLRFNNYSDPAGPFSNVVEVVLRDGIVVVKETGAGLANANSYASVDDGDIYHDGHLYAEAWTVAPLDKKIPALVMATRLIDAEYQFLGVRAVATQSLQWPRENCPDPDAGDLVAVTVVPKAVVQATCELARELIISDRTAAPPGEGLSFQNVGSTQTGYNKADTRPIIPAVVQALLAKFGVLIKSKSGSVKLVRA
ncbi:MAG: DnaT-like ssDNA-binding protein [Verrucomicrobiota bacterium]